MKKRLLLIIIILLVIALGVVTTLLILNNRNNSETPANTSRIEIDPGAKDWTETQPEDKGGEATGIKIPGYQYITIDKDSTDVKMALLNPEGNPCYFKFEICLKDTGEVLYTSKMVPPGQVITDVTLSRGLSAGEYPTVIRITTASTADGSAMNGANVETVLIAQ